MAITCLLVPHEADRHHERRLGRLADADGQQSACHDGHHQAGSATAAPDSSRSLRQIHHVKDLQVSVVRA
jgi:hypothetical protein